MHLILYKSIGCYGFFWRGKYVLWTHKLNNMIVYKGMFRGIDVYGSYFLMCFLCTNKMSIENFKVE